MHDEVLFPVPRALMETLRDLGVTPAAMVEALGNQLFDLAFTAVKEQPRYYELHATLEELYGEWHSFLEDPRGTIVLIPHRLPLPPK